MKKPSLKKEIRELVSRIDALRELHNFDKRKIEEQATEIRRLQTVNKQRLIDSLSRMLEANAKLTDGAAKIIEPGTF